MFVLVGVSEAGANVLLGLSSESKGEVLEWVNSVIKVVDASEVIDLVGNF